MSSRSERKSLMEGTDFIRRHSLNQEVLKKAREGRERGRDPKADKAEWRRMKEEEFVRDWTRKQSELNLAPEKRFKLAVKRRNDRDIQLLFNNDDDFEALGYRVNRFTFPAERKIESTKIIESVSTIGPKAA